MQKEEIFKIVQDIIREVIGDSKIDIELTTTPNDITKWDSLNHALIIDKIEKQFNFKFDLFEIMELESVENFVLAISGKLNA